MKLVLGQKLNPSSVQNARRFHFHNHSHVSSPSMNLVAHSKSANLKVQSKRSLVIAQATISKDEDIQVTKEMIDRGHVVLTITAPPAVVNAAWKTVMTYLKQNVALEGFRKGNAKNKDIPDAVFIQAMGGIGKIKSYIVEEVLKQTMPKVLKEWETQPVVADSDRIESSLAEMEASIDKDKAFVFKLGLDMMPQYSFKKPYTGLDVTVTAAGNEDTAKRTVERTILSYLKSKGQLRVRTDAAGTASSGAVVDDVVIVDITSVTRETDDVHSSAKAGEVIPGMRRRGLKIDPTSSDIDSLVPGLVSGIVGLKAGDERKVPVVFPDEWDPETLRGVKALIHVTCREVFRWEIPTEKDEMAAELAPGCKNMTEARKALLEAVLARQEADTRTAIQEDVAKQLGAIADWPIPRKLFEDYATNMYQMKLQELSSNKTVDYKTLETLATPEATTNYMKTNRDKIEEQARIYMAIDHIIEKEAIAPTEREIEVDYQLAKQEMEAAGMDLDEATLKEQVMETLRKVKALEWLASKANVKVLPNKTKV